MDVVNKWMRAFSEHKKSCLCQVPKSDRRSQLPSFGCKFWGWQGWNPVDIRGGKFKNKRNPYKTSQNFRVPDDFNQFNDYDRWYQAKAELETQMMRISNLNEISVIGLGIPKRSSSYILGIHYAKEDNYKRSHN